MSIFLTVLTYCAYVFIIAMYSVKLIKIARTPAHLRWELYPVVHEAKKDYGSGYYEDVARWRKNRRKTVRKGILHLLVENFRFTEHFQRNRGYWAVLLPWHTGFIFIVGFHILCFFGAVVMAGGNIPVTVTSPEAIGRVFYYLIMVTGVISFITGAFGSIGLLIKRLGDRDLKAFATPKTYFNYIFTLAVFGSGLYAWIFVDPTFAEYREYWAGLITLNPVNVAGATTAHIILFALFLIYLPFTRSLHYITKFFAYLWIRWDDAPAVKGSKLEKDIAASLKKPVSWAAPHAGPGKSWAETVAGKKDDAEKT
jgi:nitrate reductase gamma subunit